MLQKQKGGTTGLSPEERTAKVIFVLNYLRTTGAREDPPILAHHALTRNPREELPDGI